MALPLLGTGGGGAGWQKAGVLEALLDAALVVAKAGIDVVLVVNSSAAYAAAQRLRARRLRSFWPERSTAELAKAQRLAGLARAGKLVPFIGAGASRAAGLPGWSDLLKEIAVAVGYESVADQNELAALDPRDAALVLQRRAGGRLDDMLRARFSPDLPSSLTHALLASLPVSEAATTNYDRLFEQAWAAAGSSSVKVLPREDTSTAERWLLKLHGDVDDDKKPLVLTREQYLGFAQTGGAIAGVLQAMLLTRHLLIVGYGLSDETFHRIAHDVREVRATPIAAGIAASTTGPKLGTALLVTQLGMAEGIWSDDLDLVSFHADDDVDASVRRQARFLDLVGLLAAPIEAYVLGEGFAGLSADGADRELRRLLESLRAHVPELDSEMRRAVQEVLSRFGDTAPQETTMRPGARSRHL